MRRKLVRLKVVVMTVFTSNGKGMPDLGAVAWRPTIPGEHEVGSKAIHAADLYEDHPRISTLSSRVPGCSVLVILVY